MTVFVSEEEMKSKQLENDSFVGVTKHVIRSRTDRFRPFFPSELRDATINVSVENIVWELRPEAIDDFYDSSESIENDEAVQALSGSKPK